MLRTYLRPNFFRISVVISSAPFLVRPLPSAASPFGGDYATWETAVGTPRPVSAGDRGDRLGEDHGDGAAVLRRRTP